MMEEVVSDLADLRLLVTRHPLLCRTWSLHALHLIMEHHVVAVWDFMSLLKTLQKNLTNLDCPWMPPHDPICARMINELVLAEETDQINELSFTGSHFELYLAAMDELGADTHPMEQFIAKLSLGIPLAIALEQSVLPIASQKFARHTLLMAQRRPHEVAASFLFGREDIIADMFSRILENLPNTSAPYFRSYLKRHIDLDGNVHSQLSKTILNSLCGQNEKYWQEASDAAASSLVARVKLWDEVYQQVLALEGLNSGENLLDESKDHLQKLDDARGIL